MILNLTPHPIRIYRSDRQDGSDDLDEGLLHSIDPAAIPARLGMVELGTEFRCGVAVELVEYTHAQDLPGREEGVSYIVSLPVALGLAAKRNDLLVPYREVRNSTGTVIGCRQLAQPV